MILLKANKFWAEGMTVHNPCFSLRIQLKTKLFIAGGNQWYSCRIPLNANQFWARAMTVKRQCLLERWFKKEERPPSHRGSSAVKYVEQSDTRPAYVHISTLLDWTLMAKQTLDNHDYSESMLFFKNSIESEPTLSLRWEYPESTLFFKNSFENEPTLSRRYDCPGPMLSDAGHIQEPPPSSTSQAAFKHPPGACHWLFQEDHAFCQNIVEPNGKTI